MEAPHTWAQLLQRCCVLYIFVRAFSLNKLWKAKTNGLQVFFILGSWKPSQLLQLAQQKTKPSEMKPLHLTNIPQQRWKQATWRRDGPQRGIQMAKPAPRFPQDLKCDSCGTVFSSQNTNRSNRGTHDSSHLSHCNFNSQKNVKTPCPSINLLLHPSLSAQNQRGTWCCRPQQQTIAKWLWIDLRMFKFSPGAETKCASEGTILQDNNLVEWPPSRWQMWV